MTSTLLDPVAQKAARLVTASERLSFDPMTEIDWTQDIGDTHLHLPAEYLPLYGTPQWDAMTEQERFAYSRHECAALCGAGIWFENILMQLVLRHLYDLPADDPTHRYLLVETADECRHSTMFGEYIRRAGTPAYRPGLRLRLLGKVFLRVANKATGYAGILAAEELLDASNRATMKDPAVHPVSRDMARIHVAEEARHVSFAKTWLAERWSTLSRVDRGIAMVLTPLVAFGIVDSIIDPQVAKAVGIKGGTGAARRNPHQKARVKTDLRKLTGFLTEVGVINRATQPIWRGLGLMA
jgi:hypothetical protein